MKIQNGSIIPGVGISNIKLGITKEKLLEFIGENYQEQPLEIGSLIVIENAKFTS